MEGCHDGDPGRGRRGEGRGSLREAATWPWSHGRAAGQPPCGARAGGKDEVIWASLNQGGEKSCAQGASRRTTTLPRRTRHRSAESRFDILDAMNQSPAVCALPAEEACQFIRDYGPYHFSLCWCGDPLKG